MAPTALEVELEITLDAALTFAEPGTKLPTIAERVYQSEPALVEQLCHPWMVERFIWILRRKRRKIAAWQQFLLPGFEQLPGRITIRDRHWRSLRFAKLEDLKQYRAVLQERRDPRLVQLDKLIALVSLYKQRGASLTVLEVMEKEQAKLKATGPQVGVNSTP